MTPTPTNELYHSVFTDAIEGGMTTQWARVESYHWMIAERKAPSVDELCDYEGFYADIEECGDEDSGPKFRIDRAVIERGMRLACFEWAGKIHWQCGKPPPVIIDEDGWDYDAIDADVIVQLGLFADVVYG